MAKRALVFVSKTDPTETLVVVAESAAARTQADATLGLANWNELDVTGALAPAAGDLVQAARERVLSADGTGRWRWRTTSDAVKAWLGEPRLTLCPACDQPTTEDKTLEIHRLIEQHRRIVNALEARVAELEQLVAGTATAPPLPA